MLVSFGGLYTFRWAKGYEKSARGLPKVQSGAGLELEIGDAVYGTAVHLERWLMHDIRVAQALRHLTYFHGLGNENWADCQQCGMQ